jgi:hypothetical protein
MMIDAQHLVELVNRTAVRLWRRHDTCVASTAALIRILAAHDIQARALRVEAHVWPPSGHPPNVYGSVLGSAGDGSRRPAAKPGMWHGHLACLAEESWLLDSTLDQVCYGKKTRITAVRIKPLAARIPEGFLELPAERWAPGTPLDVPQADGWYARYWMFRRQVGWKSAGAFRPSQHADLVYAVLDELDRRRQNIVLDGDRANGRAEEVHRA